MKITLNRKKKMYSKARSVLENAYSPYSKVKVAAAVIDERGRIFTGVNVENASLGLTICAERNAIANAIANKAKNIKGVLIISNVGLLSPCGACRQVIAELAFSNTPIFLADFDGIKKELTIGELLPDNFNKNNVIDDIT